ncbi:hypothetical protein FACS1894166_08850 [Bacilli bacterium]|nr:hypothetical protein FACS1894166_08850 [Bacilli bacterium]
MIIMAFMYCFGRKTATHTNGVDFATIPKMEGGLFLGGLVIILLFGGIAIIVNGVFNKIGILIITIGIAVVLNIINTVIPFIATTPDKYISRVYKNEMDSSRYIDVDGKFHNAVYALNNYTDSSNNYYGTEYYADQGNKNTSGAFPSYINVGSQLSEIFNAFTTNKKFDETANAFGEDYTYRYSLRTTEASNEITPILKYNLAPEQKFNLDPKTNPFLPNIYMKVRTKDYQQQVSYRVFGPSTTDLLLYSFLGMKDDAVAYYRPNTVNLLKYIGRVKFYSREDVYNLPPKDIPEIMANIGTCSPSLHLGAEPTLIQQFEVM